MRKLTELEKNMLTCTILNVVVGLGMTFLAAKPKLGIFCYVCAAAFFIALVILYVTEAKRHPRTAQQRKQAEADKKALQQATKRERKYNAELAKYIKKHNDLDYDEAVAKFDEEYKAKEGSKEESEEADDEIGQNGESV